MRFLTSVFLTILMIPLAATYALVPAREEELETQWLPVEDSLNQAEGRQVLRVDSPPADSNNCTITSWRASDVSI